MIHPKISMIKLVSGMLKRYFEFSKFYLVFELGLVATEE